MISGNPGDIGNHQISPNSVHTVGVLAVTLGMAGSSVGRFHVYVDQLLCAGAVLGTCCLAPVQARRSVASFSPEKHDGFSTLFLSGQKVVLLAPGRSWVAPEGPWMSLQGSLEVPPEPLLESFFQGPSSRMPTLRSLFKWSFLEIPLAGFPPRIPLLEFPLEDSSARIPLSGFLLQDFPAGFLS